jgi:hypothetical protein
MKIELSVSVTLLRNFPKLEPRCLESALECEHQPFFFQDQPIFLSNYLDQRPGRILYAQVGNIKTETERKRRENVAEPDCSRARPESFQSLIYVADNFVKLGLREVANNWVRFIEGFLVTLAYACHEGFLGWSDHEASVTGFRYL